MTAGQRVVIWIASVALVLAAVAFAWRGQMIPYNIWIELPPVSLPLPKARAFAPGEDGNPPLLIVVENTPEARPQAGLADACLVYAVPTESRITRFLTAYCDEAPRVVGPVRSVRRYMLDIAGDLGGILVHAGHSAEALAHIRARRIPVINEFWTSGAFWRDERRRMPHNLYTGIDRLRAQLQKHPIALRPRGVPYAFGQTPAEGSAANVVTLDYGPLYTVRYRYDAVRRHYTREQHGHPHVDAAGKQITPTSVIVMFVQWWDVVEPTGPSSKINLIGSGRLVVLAGGQLTEGTWKRSAIAPLALTVGNQRVVVPRGPVWIELFPADQPFSVQSESVKPTLQPNRAPVRPRI